MDIGIFLGVLVAIGAIIGGNIMEGGHLESLIGIPAFIIVIGGTIGAVMVAFPKADFIRGLKLGKSVFKEEKIDINGLVVQLVEMAS